MNEQPRPMRGISPGRMASPPSRLSSVMAPASLGSDGRPGELFCPPTVNINRTAKLASIRLVRDAIASIADGFACSEAEAIRHIADSYHCQRERVEYWAERGIVHADARQRFSEAIARLEGHFMAQRLRRLHTTDVRLSRGRR